MALSSKHLTHKHATFNGCTFVEAAFVFLSVALCNLCFIVVLTGMFGLWYVWFCLNLMTYPMFKAFSAALGKRKANRPYGHFTQGVRLGLSRLGVLSLPYFTHTGRLSVRRPL